MTFPNNVNKNSLKRISKKFGNDKKGITFVPEPKKHIIMANKKDSTYVSRETHEITTICNLYREPNGTPVNAPLLYHIITQMYEMTKGKVLRVNLYKALVSMGYKKKQK